MLMVKMIWIYFDNFIIIIGKEVLKLMSRYIVWLMYKNNVRSRLYIIRIWVDLKILIVGNVWIGKILEFNNWWMLFKNIVMIRKSINLIWLFGLCFWKLVFDSINLIIKKKIIFFCKFLLVLNIVVGFL